MRYLRRILIVLVMVALPTVSAFSSDSSEETHKSDALRFKEDYESLNGAPRSEKTFALYNTVHLPEDNPVRYINAGKAAELMDSQYSVIYFGANWCPWCRNIVPVLLNESAMSGLQTLFYVDVTEERDKYELNGDMALKTADGTSGYSRLLAVLDDYLEPYTLTSDCGKTIDTGEKRLYIPFLLVIEKGRVMHAKLCTYELEPGQSKYDPLTESQRDYLHLLFSEVLKTAR